MHSYIVTGASKGLGAALVRALLRPGNSVFGISRSLNEALIAESNADDVERGVRVNLLAPMILTHSFIRHFGSARVRRTVINVSSGAGISPMAGLSTYSTTKAGLNMFTRAAAQEHGSDAAGSEFRFYAVSPGTVDTGMQETLREAGPSVLPNHETYLEWKKTGSLVSPEDAARTVLTLLDRENVENGAFMHRRDLTTEDQ